MDSREYREKVASRRDSYRTLENIIRELPGAVELLRQYEELRTDCETLLANSMFMYGAELMEEEGAKKIWHIIDKPVY